MTLHMDITRWSTLKSDWLYSLQPTMEKLYTVSKNKTRSWLWLRSWAPYCKFRLILKEVGKTIQTFRYDLNQTPYDYTGFPDSSVGKESACNAGDSSSIPGSGRSAGEGIGYPFQYPWASLVTELVKNLPTVRKTWVWSLGWEEPRGKGKATDSSILACLENSMGCISSWGHKKLDTTERLSLHFTMIIPWRWQIHSRDQKGLKNHGERFITLSWTWWSKPSQRKRNVKK